MEQDRGEQAAALVVTRVIKQGCEDKYRDWANRVLASARAAPGHLGALQFEQSGGLCHVVQRFRSHGELQAWEEGEDYRRLMAAGDAFSTSRHQHARGEEWTAQLPCEADSPKWKRFLMTWAAVLPLVLLVNAGLHALPRPLPLPVQSLISSFVLVGSMTWFILPAVSRRLKPWVMRDGEGDAPIKGGGAAG